MNRIKELRLSKGLHQDELGALLCVGKGAISKYEKGDRQLDPAKINALCDYFGCTSDYLLCRSDNPYPQISKEDTQILQIYHGLPPEIRRAVDGLMAPYAPQAAEEKNAG